MLYAILDGRVASKSFRPWARGGSRDWPDMGKAVLEGLQRLPVSAAWRGARYGMEVSGGVSSMSSPAKENENCWDILQTSFSNLLDLTYFMWMAKYLFRMRKLGGNVWQFLCSTISI